MTTLMDDPTTYLTRDPANLCVILAGTVGIAMDVCRSYGVAIQVNMPTNQGIHVVTNQADALNVVATLPNTTPWCLIADGLTDQTARDLLTGWLGKPQTIAKALGVNTDGIAWRPDRYRMDL